ncbi:hypothetical protein ACFQ4Z_20420 [Oceanobacillus oncorhynchi subsp. oncorhynchi]|uniref:hypothetical protein n=1 Tax=Oceanobacillus oncorhynchi TaxID=545501 RepID=UPI0036439167
MIMTLLAACSIGSSENSNEKAGFLAEMKEMDDKLGNDKEDEIDYDDTLDNEKLIDLALETFMSEGENGVFSGTESSSATIEEVKDATEIKVWHNKYIYIKVNADDPQTHSGDDYERYYKYEDGDLVDSQCYSDQMGTECNEANFNIKELNLRDEEPDYLEENDTELDLTKTFE